MSGIKYIHSSAFSSCHVYCFCPYFATGGKHLSKSQIFYCDPTLILGNILKRYRQSCCFDRPFRKFRQCHRHSLSVLHRPCVSTTKTSSSASSRISSTGCPAFVPVAAGFYQRIISRRSHNSAYPCLHP